MDSPNTLLNVDITDELKEYKQASDAENSKIQGFTFFYNKKRWVSTKQGNLEILRSERKPSIIALTETWFKSGSNAELFCLEGYHRTFASTRTKNEMAL